MQTHTQMILQKHPLLMHIQHKYVFHVSVTNSYFPFFLLFYVSAADSVVEETGAMVCVCFCTKRSRGPRVSRGHFPLGTPLNDSGDLLASSVVGVRSSRSQRGVEGSFEATWCQYVTFSHTHRIKQINSLNKVMFYILVEGLTLPIV